MKCMNRKTVNQFVETSASIWLWTCSFIALAVVAIKPMSRDRHAANNWSQDYHFRGNGTFAHRIRNGYNTLAYKWLLALIAV